ncbi:O-antigen polymerase [Aeromonas mytilicola]
MIPSLVTAQALVWIVIILLSVSPFNGVKPIGHEASIIVLSGVMVTLIGGVIGAIIPLKRLNFTIYSFSLKQIRFIVLICFLLVLYSASKAFSYILVNGFLNFRDMAFIVDPDTGESLVFGSVRLQFFISTFIKPLLYFFFILLLFEILINKTKCKFEFVMVLFTIVVISMSTLGRFFVYHIIILLVAALILSFKYTSWLYRSKSIKNIIISFSFLIATFFVLSLARGGGEIVSAIINYHTVGLYTFSSELEDTRSFLNGSPTWSAASLGIFERLYVIILNKFGFELVSSVADIGVHLNTFRDVGRSSGLFMNAFATWYYTLYYDGGYIYVLLYLFLYGLILSYNERLFIKYCCAQSFVISISIFFISYFSIFASMIESSYILIPLMAVFFIRRNGFKKWN